MSDRQGRPAAKHDPRPVLITGGAGFVGTNLADRLCRAGQPVTVFDNLSRPGVERNAAWLRATHGDLVQIETADIRDARAVGAAVAGASAVFHFAAQVAVTSSLVSPVHDFEVNARGTLNVLEAVRARGGDAPPVVFTSTNKVYGGLEDVEFRLRGDRYEPCDDTLRARGIAENRPLDFYSPYGCSKGAADQYVLDYARTFGLRATVFRMSCIYGPHQCGTEDQGWLAHFLIQALHGRPVTLYGDGKQVRDVLFVDDLVDAFLLALERADALSGRAFNLGGGVGNTTSLLELLEEIETLHGRAPALRRDDWRPGDQRYYVSDFSRFREATGWTPRVAMREGTALLYHWLREHHAAPAPAETHAAAVLA